MALNPTPEALLSSQEVRQRCNHLLGHIEVCLIVLPESTSLFFSNMVSLFNRCISLALSLFLSLKSKIWTDRCLIKTSHSTDQNMWWHWWMRRNTVAHLRTWICVMVKGSKRQDSILVLNSFRKVWEVKVKVTLKLVFTFLFKSFTGSALITRKAQMSQSWSPSTPQAYGRKITQL